MKNHLIIFDRLLMEVKEEAELGKHDLELIQKCNIRIQDKPKDYSITKMSQKIKILHKEEERELSPVFQIIPRKMQERQRMKK